MFKKILFLLLLSLTLSCSSPKEPIQVDWQISRDVNQFVEDAAKSGVNVETLRDSLDYIVVEYLHPNLYGRYRQEMKAVVINVFYTLDPIILKKTIYHELGHALGLKHKDGGIMETYMNEDQVRAIYDPHSPTGIIMWESHKKKLFDQIKKVQSERKELNKGKGKWFTF